MYTEEKAATTPTLAFIPWIRQFRVFDTLHIRTSCNMLSFIWVGKFIAARDLVQKLDRRRGWKKRVLPADRVFQLISGKLVTYQYYRTRCQRFEVEREREKTGNQHRS